MLVSRVKSIKGMSIVSLPKTFDRMTAVAPMARKFAENRKTKLAKMHRINGVTPSPRYRWMNSQRNRLRFCQLDHILTLAFRLVDQSLFKSIVF